MNEWKTVVDVGGVFVPVRKVRLLAGCLRLAQVHAITLKSPDSRVVVALVSSSSIDNTPQSIVSSTEKMQPRQVHSVFKKHRKISS